MQNFQRFLSELQGLIEEKDFLGHIKGKAGEYHLEGFCYALGEKEFTQFTTKDSSIAIMLKKTGIEQSMYNTTTKELKFIISNDEIERLFSELEFNSLNISENNSKNNFYKNEKKRFTKEGKNLGEVLRPLTNGLFFDDETINAVMLRFGIYDILNDKLPSYPGGFLYGPPGTGKTTLLNKIGETFENLGGIYRPINPDENLSKGTVGARGKEISKSITKILEETREKETFGLIALDEATTIGQKVYNDQDASKWHQEGIDALKRFIGNYKELIFCITTNEDIENLDPALKRSGRLYSIKLDYPDEEQRAKMWEYFTEKYIGEILTKKESIDLSRNTGKKEGSLIEEICRTYIPNKKSQMLKEKGLNLLKATSKGIYIEDELVLEEIYKNGYDKLKKEFLELIQKRKDCKETKNQVGFKI